MIGDIGKQLGLGITMAEQIENDLQAQIEALDDIYDENMEAKARLKRYGSADLVLSSPSIRFSGASTLTSSPADC